MAGVSGFKEVIKIILLLVFALIALFGIKFLYDSLVGR